MYFELVVFFQLRTSAKDFVYYLSLFHWIMIERKRVSFSIKHPCG